MATPADRALFARPYWNAATRYGKPDATTTFHTQYDKRDCNYSYGRCHTEFVRQDGQRGMALGYLSKVRFVRFVSTPLATELTGIDLTRPGQSAEQAARVNVVALEFFDLLVQYSLSHPFRDGDYGNVARSRELPHGSFCIFTGFAEALASKEFKALKRTWKARYAPRLPMPLSALPTPPSPASPAPASPARAAPASAAPASAAPAPPPRAPSPPPPPPSPVPARRDRPFCNARIVDPMDDRLEEEMYESFREALVTSCLPVSAYNASGCCVRHDEPLYCVQQVRRRQRGSEQACTKTTLVLKGALRKRMRRSALSHLEEIRNLFARLGPSRN